MTVDSFSLGERCLENIETIATFDAQRRSRKGANYSSLLLSGRGKEREEKNEGNHVRIRLFRIEVSKQITRSWPTIYRSFENL